MVRLPGICLMLLALILSFAGNSRAGDAAGFTFADTAGKYLDVLLDGKIAARYMYAHDTSTPATRLETYKPYLHVYDAEGAAPITKGAGGNYTHHRGIFIGWNKIAYDAKSYDLWHMKDADIVHQKFLEQKGGPDQATFTSQNFWIIQKDKTLIEEERIFTIHRGPAPARLTIDVVSKLKAVAGDVQLDGDPEHAGVHFRPANEIVAKETVYEFPKENADAHKDLDLSWIAESYTLSGKRYSVVEISHPDNPKKMKTSAYRDYGRFGFFFVAPIKSGETFTPKFRFIIADGEMPPVEAIQKSWDEFAGATGTPIPKLTVKPAEITAEKKPAAK